MTDHTRVELHINNVCQLAYFELCCIISNAVFFLLTVQKHLYRLLPFLGYANASCCFHLKAVLNTFFRHYEKVQNSAARHAQGVLRDNFLLLLRALHWLPIQLHTEYKLSTLCHSSFSDTAPGLIFFMCPLYQDSSTPPLTQEPFAFHMLQSKYLNFVLLCTLLLPSGILCLMKLRHIRSTTAFKTDLQTHLFKTYLC